MVAKISTRPYLRPSPNTKAFIMSHAIPNEINQSLIQTNTRAAQAWVDKVRQEAQSGNARAKAVLEMTHDEDGKRAIWAFVSLINLALAACAMELPVDEEDSKKKLADVIERFPQLGWGIEDHLAEFPLEDLNEDLTGASLVRARDRLKRWVGIQ